jgi:hypothetical protein
VPREAQIRRPKCPGKPGLTPAKPDNCPAGSSWRGKAGQALKGINYVTLGKAARLLLGFALRRCDYRLTNPFCSVETGVAWEKPDGR